MSAFDLLLNPFAIVYCLIMGVLLYGIIYGTGLWFKWIKEQPVPISVRPYHEQEVIQRLEAAWDTWMRLIAKADRDDLKYLEDIAASLLKSVEMSEKLAEAEELTEREANLNRALQFRLDTIEGFLCTIDERTKKRSE